MLSILSQIEMALPALLQDEAAWHGLFADSEQPHLHRLWRQWGEYRISLHHFSECCEGQEFWHPHPWKMAVRVLKGRYEHRVGFVCETGENIEVARSIMEPGSCYEMVSPRGAHAILPIDNDVWSVMVSGPVVWNKNRRVGNTPSRELNEQERREMFTVFRTYFPLPA